MRAEFVKGLLALGAVLLSPLCAAVPKELVFPEPGLYQEDFESTSSDSESRTIHKNRHDGRSGDQVSIKEGPDGKSVRTYKGKGQVTTCIKPLPPAQAAQQLAFLPGKRCRTDSFTATSDGAIAKGTCPNGAVTVQIRKLGPGQWERRIDLASGRVNMGSGAEDLIAWIQLNAKNARTEAERVKAAQSVAEIQVMAKKTAAANAAMVEEYRASAAKAHRPEDKARFNEMAASVGTTFVPNATVRMRLTKIADTCE